VAYRIYLYEEHGFLGCVYDLISLSSWLFMVFNLWNGPGFGFERCS